MSRPDGARARLVDVARAARVSVSVASRALGGYGGVAPATRERVLAAARRAGLPRQLARPLARRRQGRPAALRRGRRRRPAAGAGALLPRPRLRRDHGRGGPGGDGHVQLVTSAPSEPAEPALQAFHRLVAEDRADGVHRGDGAAPLAGRTRARSRRWHSFVLANRHFGDRPASCVTLRLGGGHARRPAPAVRAGAPAPGAAAAASPEHHRDRTRAGVAGGRRGARPLAGPSACAAVRAPRRGGRGERAAR